MLKDDEARKKSSKGFIQKRIGLPLITKRLTNARRYCQGYLDRGTWQIFSSLWFIRIYVVQLFPNDYLE